MADGTDGSERFGGAGFSAPVSPAEARMLLASLPPASRGLLARAVALSLVLDEVPPVSLAPEQAVVADPPRLAGLLEPVSARDQHLLDGTVWGVVLPGLVGVARTWRLVSVVLALLSGEVEDGWAWYVAAADYAQLRQFP